MEPLLSLIEDPVWYPYTSVPHQGPRSKIVRAEGAYIYTASGEKKLDATSSWWCQIHGHCHPALTEALTNQAKILDHVMMAPHSHEAAQGLACDLLSVMGEPFEKVFFSDNGSTAVEVAVKMLIQLWRMRGEDRSQFLTLKEGYHGDTLGTIALSGTDFFHRHFRSAAALSVQAEAPYCYRCPLGKTYPACEVGCLGSVERVLKGSAKKFAGAVIEPLVLGAGGMIIYPASYLEGFMRLCQEYGVPVIFDEVFTGFGRTGKLFAYQSLSMKPEIVCLSKGLTSGMIPLGATVTTKRVFEGFCGGPDNAFYHGHTFTGNALACAVARASLALFEKEKVLQRNEKLMETLKAAQDRFLKLSHVGDVRQVGMIWALELVKDKTKKALPSPKNVWGWEACQRMWDKGFWLRPLHQMLYLIPPYCTKLDELQSVLDALYQTLIEMEQEGLFETLG